jgi:16S rRNA (cytosine1402-N4)-methyltransferase
VSGGAHVPVLLGPVLEGLAIRADGCYVDATFGRGGHSSAILERLGALGRLVAIDRDPQAIDAAPAALTDDPRFELVRSEFAELQACIGERGLSGRVDGLLLDLGVSSPQLDEPARGFSFLRDGPLDMRMDPETGTSAAEWLQTVDEKSLKHVLKFYGEEKHAARIARDIVHARKEMPIRRTGQLADIVAQSANPRAKKRHPATRTFQAIRIFINQELEQLQAALEQSIELLAPAGRLCVISFHSLEDRMVKRFIRDASMEPKQFRGMPNVPAEYRPKLRAIGRAGKASADEIAVNPRARSARLRVAERI